MERRRKALVDAFRAVMAQPATRLDLLDAAVAVAWPEYPLLRPESVKGQLDAWARTARARVAAFSETPGTPELLASVCQVLFKEVGLKGNQEDYDDPRNSFVNEVVERRVGLPITLSLIFMEVANRVGLDAHGVGFPGHFLARVEDPVEDGTFVVVDGFSGGAILGVQELTGLLKRVLGEEARLTPAMLAPVPPHGIVVRMLRNLKAAYTHQEDFARAVLAQERILVLEPNTPTEIRDHGLLLAHVDEPGAAIKALERYLVMEPTAEDAEEVGHTLGVLREHGFNVN